MANKNDNFYKSFHADKLWAIQLNGWLFSVGDQTQKLLVQWNCWHALNLYYKLYDFNDKLNLHCKLYMSAEKLTFINQKYCKPWFKGLTVLAHMWRQKCLRHPARPIFRYWSLSYRRLFGIFCLSLTFGQSPFKYLVTQDC